MIKEQKLEIKLEKIIRFARITLDYFIFKIIT